MENKSKSRNWTFLTTQNRLLKWEAPDLILCGDSVVMNCHREGFTRSNANALLPMGPRKNSDLGQTNMKRSLVCRDSQVLAGALWLTRSPSMRPATPVKHLEECRVPPLTFRPANSCLLKAANLRNCTFSSEDLGTRGHKSNRAWTQCCPPEWSVMIEVVCNLRWPLGKPWATWLLSTWNGASVTEDIFVATPWELSSPIRDWIGALAMKVLSPNYQTTREIPQRQNF